MKVLNMKMCIPKVWITDHESVDHENMYSNVLWEHFECILVALNKRRLAIIVTVVFFFSLLFMMHLPLLLLPVPLPLPTSFFYFLFFFYFFIFLLYLRLLIVFIPTVDVCIMCIEQEAEWDMQEQNQWKCWKQNRNHVNISYEYS